MDLKSNYIPPVKLKRTSTEENQNDAYCFQCHREGEVLNCNICPRVYHSKCLRLPMLPERSWTCPGCEITQSSFNIITQRYSINELRGMLKHALHRVKSYPQAEPFLNSIDLILNPDYSAYIIHPMDLQIMERKLHLNKYNSTEMFLNDIKWILHNSIIYNGDQSKFTQIARILLKKARHEISEIDICPECYRRSADLEATEWFTEPCSIPHALCWAKMKSYPSWPAKVLRIVNDEVDVRFFGRHDRAWIPYNRCWILSKDYPGGEKKRSNIHFERSLTELESHIEQLKKLYGNFLYAPPHTLLNKTKSFKFVSIIDDSILPSYMTVGATCSSNLKQTDKRPNEQPVKRLRTSSNQTDGELQSTLNVFDIFNQSDSRISNHHRIQPIFRSTSPTDNKYLIQGLIRRYTHIEPFNPDVRSTMSALLDAVEVPQIIPEVQTNIIDQLTEIQSSPRKKSRKSNSQHRIIPQNSNSNFLTCLSLDRYLSPTLPFVPLRPLSVSPPSVEIFEAVSSEIDEQLNPREDESRSVTQSSISINSFFIPSSLDETTSLPMIIPCISPISQQNIWPSVLSIDPPRKQRLKPISSSSSNHQNSIQIPDEFPSDDHPIRDEIQTIVHNFKDQFEQLLVDLTSRIDSSLENTRMKYEKDLDSIHRSYRLSLTDLHSIATEQIQDIHHHLELEYWQRLAEMRHRYESKLH